MDTHYVKRYFGEMADAIEKLEKEVAELKAELKKKADR